MSAFSRIIASIGPKTVMFKLGKVVVPGSDAADYNTVHN